MTATIHKFRPRTTDTARAFDLYTYATGLDEDDDTRDEAEQLYRQAIHLNPKLAIAYVNLGNILFNKGDTIAAEKLYKDAVDIDNTIAEAHYNLGYVHLEVRGDPKKAAPLLLRAVELSPTFHDARFNLCVALIRSGQKDSARRHLREYIEMTKNNGHLVAWARARLKEL